jgi:hypothetical protein
MQHESKQDQNIDHYTERLVVLQALGQKQGIAITRVRAELDDIDQGLVDAAVASLQSSDVLVIDCGRLHLSSAAQRLDELCMIAI